MDLQGLFRAHRRDLQCYLARRVRCADTAADLVQEAFLRIAEQPSGINLRDARAYLYRTAHNLAIDHARKMQRQQTYPTAHEALTHIPDDTPAIEDRIAHQQQLDLLLAAITELPLLTRRIFALNRIDGLTYAEVAQHLDISESTVQKHLARALLRAMQRLNAL